MTSPSYLDVESGGRFAVRRIWCVGQNYSEHAREMGADPTRTPPFFFAKPADAIVRSGATLAFPPFTANLHHEVELAVAFARGGENLSAQEAAGCIAGCALALDMTRRDLQDEAKRLSRPWDMAKGFDQSCPIGTLRPVSGAPPTSGAIRLRVNGEDRQTGDLSQMIWSIADCAAVLSHYVAIRPGDILLTGTPAGVGPVMPGDVLEADCEAAPSLRVVYERSQPELRMHSDTAARQP